MKSVGLILRKCEFTSIAWVVSVAQVGPHFNGVLLEVLVGSRRARFAGLFDTVSGLHPLENEEETEMGETRLELCPVDLIPHVDPLNFCGIGEAFDGMAKVVRATDLFGGRIHDPCHNLIQSKHVVRQVRVVVQFLGPSLDGIHLIPIFSEELVPDLTNLHT